MRLSFKSPVNRYNINRNGKYNMAYRIITESISEIMRTNEDKNNETKQI